MKITIEQDGLKRVLEGEFSICMSRSDMEMLVRSLTTRLADPTWGYGWHDIRTPLPCVQGAPLPWKEI